MKKVSLELGGKSPLVIFEDCDLEKAVRNVSILLLISIYITINIDSRNNRNIFFYFLDVFNLKKHQGTYRINEAFKIFKKLISAKVMKASLMRFP